MEPRAIEAVEPEVGDGDLRSGVQRSGTMTGKGRGVYNANGNKVLRGMSAATNSKVRARHGGRQRAIGLRGQWEVGIEKTTTKKQQLAYQDEDRISERMFSPKRLLEPGPTVSPLEMDSL